MTAARLIAIAMLVLFAAPAHAQGDTATHAPLRLLRDALDVANAARFDRTQEWVRAHIQASQLAERGESQWTNLLQALHDDGGDGLTVSRVLDQGQRYVVAEVWNAYASKGTMMVAVIDSTDSTRLRRLDAVQGLHDDARIRLDSAHFANADSALAAVSGEVTRLASAGELSGVVLIARGDSVVLARAVGLANRETNTPVALDTRFHFASMGKMFTAVGIAQLVSQGKLALDDTVARLLPEYRKNADARRITVRMLLSHTSGLVQPTELPPAGTPRYFRLPLQFAPGTRFSYSNENFELLGTILERRSGIPYNEYIRTHVFEPAGMTLTAAIPADTALPDRAVGYAHDQDDYFSIRAPHNTAAFLGHHIASGSGGQYGTARDLLRFARALENGKLLPPAWLDTLVAARQRMSGDPRSQYGYGFIVAEIGGHHVFGHGGGGAWVGIDDQLMSARDGAWTVVTLSNQDPGVATALNDAILHVLMPHGASDAPLTTSATPAP